MQTYGLFHRPRAILFAALALAACQGKEPTLEERYAVNTPVFADNRIYYLKRAAGNADFPRQQLQSLGASVQSTDTDVIQANDPLSIVIRSVELPALQEGSAITGPADYAVILDVATAADGSSQSLVVWYQRGVQPSQSLNFSNLLVHYEPRWDQRVAPLFRIRVMDVTKERNEQTRATLKRVEQVANVVGTFAATPLATPLISIGFAAADMVLANNQNRMILDYSVQLYSSSAQEKSGSGRLGVLKAGSYVVIGKPNDQPRTFWQQPFDFEPESRMVETNGKHVNVPTALLTVGTFESIVPKLVIERSAALTTLLASNPSKSSIEQIDDSMLRLGASIKVYTFAEKLKRYNLGGTIKEFNEWYVDGNESLIGTEDMFNFVRAAGDCLGKKFGSYQDLKNYIGAISDLKCN